MRDQQQERSGLLDFIFSQVRDAVADIRDKLVFEGWFGRRSADGGGGDWTKEPRPDAEFWADFRSHRFDPSPLDGMWWGKAERLGEPPSLEEQWAVREPAEQGAAADRGHDIDR